MDNKFKKKAVQEIDLEILRTNHVKIGHPELLGDKLLELAQEYATERDGKEVVL